MNYLEKIKKVKENIQEWQKEHGNEFTYITSGFFSENEELQEVYTLIDPKEHIEIVKYLERRGFLELLKETKSSLKIKILPKSEPIIKLKTLELISRALKDYYTGVEIIKLLENSGADKKLIIYPDSKWHIFYGLFEELTIAQDKKAKELLFRIISDSVHPLNLGGNKRLSEELVEKFNEYLKYDNLAIFYSDKEQKYNISDTKNLIEVDEDDILQNYEEVLPDINKSSFSERVLDLVSSSFNNHLENWHIRKIIIPILQRNPILYNQEKIKGYLQDDSFDESPFWTFRDTLQTIRKKDEKADETISIIIGNLLHPLNYDADEYRADTIATEMGKYLKYDDFYIQKIGNEYEVWSGKEMDEMHTSSPEFEEQERENKEEDERKIKQSKEAIRGLRDTHQAYIDILEIYCGDTKKPTKELNDAYIFLSNKIEKTIKELNLKTYPYQIFFYRPFKNDLYSAEVEWKALAVKQGVRLSWDGIRPSLYKVHSDIIKILNMAEEDSQMTDEEKKLEDITNLISAKRTQKPIPPEPEKIVKFEISKMPELNVRNIEDNVVVKNNKKRTTLPKFPRTEWSKVSITFIDERNILLSNGKDTKPSSFEGLACIDGRTGKPDDSWDFLLKMAIGRGQTPPIGKKEREKQKKQKQKITDIIRKVFNNDSEPFETQTGGVYKAKFDIKYNADISEESSKNDKYADLTEVLSEMTEQQESVEGDFSQ